MTDSIFDSYHDIIPEFNEFKESLFQPFIGHLRVNRLKMDPENLVTLLADKDINIKRASKKYDTLYEAPGLNSPGNLLEYFTGYIHSQALTSCLASLVLSPEPGSFVLDMCASPGGKTSHLAQLMNNSGLIVANELYPSRHIPLAHTIARLGVMNCIFTSYQAQEFPLRQHFDYVLADVPCSGEGRVKIASNEQRSITQTGSVNPRLLALQRKIIVRGFDLLGDKGEMLYSTCTYNPDENESVVHYLLKNRNAELLPIDTGFNHEYGLTRWRDEVYDRQMERAARFYPHQINSVGFFMARIGRR
ncbi:SAM-dependent methyltransferase [Thermodesulfobacteriota bacterium]